MSNNKLKIASLFSGIGGFEEGIKMTNIDSEIIFASEIDSFAKKSYIANFGDRNLHGDITLINEKSIPDHMLLVGGFPCQAFSIAGKQKGFEDMRGTLFFDVARILNEKKPKYILLENVKNLASHNKTKTIRRILTTLNEIGYTVDFTVINSCESGVPQNRDRTYICGIYGGVSEKFERDARNSHIDSLKMEFNLTDFKGFNFFNKVKFEQAMKHIKDIIEKKPDEKYYLNSEKVIGFLEDNPDVKDIDDCEDKIVKLFDLPRQIHNDLERQRRVYSIKGISPTVLARADTTKILVQDRGKNRIRKLTPTENFYIQGFSESFVKNIENSGMSATQMYKQSGNAVSPPVIATIIEKLYSMYIRKDME